MTTSEMTVPITNAIEAIVPFQPDDGHKGTFLILRMAGLEQSLALKVIKRKYRSILNWRTIDADFKRVDDMMPVLNQRFGGEARVMRTSLLDISIVETGIAVFRKILHQQPVKDGEWAYAVKMAGLRVPLMGAEQDTGVHGRGWQIVSSRLWFRKSWLSNRNLMALNQLQLQKLQRLLSQVLSRKNWQVKWSNGC